MLNQHARELIATYLEIARTAPDDVVSEKYLSKVSGMLDYAMVCGDITVRDFANENMMCDLVRAQRRAAK